MRFLYHFLMMHAFGSPTTLRFHDYGLEVRYYRNSVVRGRAFKIIRGDPKNRKRRYYLDEFPFPTHIKSLKEHIEAGWNE